MFEYLKLSELINFNMEIDSIVNELVKIKVINSKKRTDYLVWFLNDHVNEIYKGNADTIYVVDKQSSNIIGLCNINNKKEILTFYVEQKYARKITSELIEKALKSLKTKKPIITISSSSIKYFEDIIKEYKWNITDIDENFNYIFNGPILVDDRDLTLEDKAKRYYKKTTDFNLLRLFDSKTNAIKFLFSEYKNNKNKKKYCQID